MYKQIWLYDGTEVLLESVTKYKLENGTIVDEAPAQVAIEKEIDVVSEDTDEVTKETIIVYEDVFFEEVEVFDYPDEYTEIQPEEGLYEPIIFDGSKWVGTDKNIWDEEHPQENIDLGIDIDDIILMSEELLMQNADLVSRIEKLENEGDA